MEAGYIYLAAALVLIGLGIWAGMAIRASEVDALGKDVAGLKEALSEAEEQGNKAARAAGVVLRNARERAQYPPTPDSVRRVFRLPDDPEAPTPGRGAPRA